jgi:hypothetical protein
METSCRRSAPRRILWRSVARSIAIASARRLSAIGPSQPISRSIEGWIALRSNGASAWSQSWLVRAVPGNCTTGS